MEEDQKFKSEIYRYSLVGRYLETGLADQNRKSGKDHTGLCLEGELDVLMWKGEGCSKDPEARRSVL